jgi:hypothetical protein
MTNDESKPKVNEDQITAETQRRGEEGVRGKVAGTKQKTTITETKGFYFMTTRVGKIARLPRAIREELNQRLEEGEGGTALLDWLNGLPEVRRVMTAEFGGKPVSAQNLSQWRQGGYEDWVAHGEAMELAQRLGEEIQDWQGSEQDDRTALSEKLTVWVTARYTVAARRLGSLDEEAAWQRLREFAADMLKFRKVEQNERRLRLVEEKAGVERKAREAKEAVNREGSCSSSSHEGRRRPSDGDRR